MLPVMLKMKSGGSHQVEMSSTGLFQGLVNSTWNTYMNWSHGTKSEVLDYTSLWSIARYLYNYNVLPICVVTVERLLIVYFWPLPLCATITNEADFPLIYTRFYFFILDAAWTDLWHSKKHAFSKFSTLNIRYKLNQRMKMADMSRGYSQWLEESLFTLRWLRCLCFSATPGTIFTR